MTVIKNVPALYEAGMGMGIRRLNSRHINYIDGSSDMTFACIDKGVRRSED